MFPSVNQVQTAAQTGTSSTAISSSLQAVQTAFKQACKTYYASLPSKTMLPPSPYLPCRIPGHSLQFIDVVDLCTALGPPNTNTYGSSLNYLTSACTTVSTDITSLNNGYGDRTINRLLNMCAEYGISYVTSSDLSAMFATLESHQPTSQGTSVVGDSTYGSASATADGSYVALQTSPDTGRMLDTTDEPSSGNSISVLQHLPTHVCTSKGVGSNHVLPTNDNSAYKLSYDWCSYIIVFGTSNDAITTWLTSTGIPYINTPVYNQVPIEVAFERIGTTDGKEFFDDDVSSCYWTYFEVTTTSATKGVTTNLPNNGPQKSSVESNGVDIYVHYSTSPLIQNTIGIVTIALNDPQVQASTTSPLPPPPPSITVFTNPIVYISLYIKFGQTQFPITQSTISDFVAILMLTEAKLTPVFTSLFNALLSQSASFLFANALPSNCNEADNVMELVYAVPSTQLAAAIQSLNTQFTNQWYSTTFTSYSNAGSKTAVTLQPAKYNSAQDIPVQVSGMFFNVYENSMAGQFSIQSLLYSSASTFFTAESSNVKTNCLSGPEFVTPTMIQKIASTKSTVAGVQTAATSSTYLKGTCSAATAQALADHAFCMDTNGNIDTQVCIFDSTSKSAQCVFKCGYTENPLDESGYCEDPQICRVGADPTKPGQAVCVASTFQRTVAEGHQCSTSTGCISPYSCAQPPSSPSSPSTCQSVEASSESKSYCADYTGTPLLTCPENYHCDMHTLQCTPGILPGETCTVPTGGDDPCIPGYHCDDTCKLGVKTGGICMKMPDTDAGTPPTFVGPCLENAYCDYVPATSTVPASGTGTCKTYNTDSCTYSWQCPVNTMCLGTFCIETLDVDEEKCHQKERKCQDDQYCHVVMAANNIEVASSQCIDKPKTVGVQCGQNQDKLKLNIKISMADLCEGALVCSSATYTCQLPTADDPCLDEGMRFLSGFTYCDTSSSGETTHCDPYSRNCIANVKSSGTKTSCVHDSDCINDAYCNPITQKCTSLLSSPSMNTCTAVTKSFNNNVDQTYFCDDSKLKTRVSSGKTCETELSPYLCDLTLHCEDATNTCVSGIDTYHRCTYNNGNAISESGSKLVDITTGSLCVPGTSCDALVSHMCVPDTADFGSGDAGSGGV
jgi:hypothetical protein